MGQLLAKLFGSPDHHHHAELAQQQQKISTKHDEAVLEIKLTRDKVSKYQKQITTLMDKELDIAKRLLAEGKKDRAKLALKKRKYQDQLLKKTDQQLENLSRLVQEIEFAQIESQVVSGLKLGKDALVSIQKEMGSIEEIEQLMDESREAIAYQEEISRVLAESLTTEDEEDVENEYAEMEKNMLASDLGEIVVPTTSLPIVTTTTTTRTVQEEQQEEEQEEEDALDKSPVLV